MRIDSIPLFEKLADRRSVIVAGIGGGYDVFCGLPLAAALLRAGKQVHLANLSFSNLDGIDGRRLAPDHLEVTAASQAWLPYFPEKFLYEFMPVREERLARVHCFRKTGARPLLHAWKALCAETEADAILCIDGGTDSLMRGDEDGLGTPGEDMASIAAIAQLDVPVKLLACIGFGVDDYHGVAHADFLENVAALARDGGYLGVVPLLREMEEFALYEEAARYVFDRMPSHPSIVTSSVISAVRGMFGDHHVTNRTAGSKLWINPLMAMYWCFELDRVAGACLYLDSLKATESWADVCRTIEAFRDNLERKRPRERLPL